MSTTCQTCEAPTGDGAYACNTCMDLLITDLRDLAGYTTTDGRHVHGLLEDLAIAGARMDHIPAAMVESSEPLPVRLDAMQARRDILTAIAAWMGRLGVPFGQPATIDWLITQRAAIRNREWIGEMIQQISGESGLVVRIRRTVDRPEGVIRVLCPECNTRVPIDPDMTVIKCPNRSCGEWGTLAWWKERLQVDGDDPLPMSDLPGWLLVRHGLDKSLTALRHMQRRGVITAVTTGVHPALYDPVAVAAVILGRRRAIPRQRGTGARQPLS